MEIPELAQNLRARRFASTLTRRGLAAVLGGAALTAIAAADAAGKRKKGKKKKKKKRNRKARPITSAMATFCLNGDTVQRPVDDTAGVIADGAYAGACPQDTCAGSCAANQVCVAGTCRACTVPCGSATPAQCATVLQAALNAGGEFIACPGWYAGGFSVPSGVSVQLYGAGAGSDPARSTILDGGNTKSVMKVNPSATLQAQQVRITAGKTGAAGGSGIDSTGSVSLTDSVVIGNTSVGSGAGMYQSSTATGGVSLVRSVLTGNSATGALASGGGIAAFSASYGVFAAGAVISRNTASGSGGGIFQIAGEKTLDSACKLLNNTAGQPGGAIDSSGTVTLNGALVFGNSAPQCAGTATC